MSKNNQIKYLGMVEELEELSSSQLSNWELDFIDEVGNIVRDKNGFLSEARADKLEEIYEKYCN